MNKCKELLFQVETQVETTTTSNKKNKATTIAAEVTDEVCDYEECCTVRL